MASTLEDLKAGSSFDNSRHGVDIDCRRSSLDKSKADGSFGVLTVPSEADLRRTLHANHSMYRLIASGTYADWAEIGT